MKVTKRDINMIKRYCELKRIVLNSFYNFTQDEKIRPVRFECMFGISETSYLDFCDKDYEEWIEFIGEAEQFFITKGRKQDKEFGFKKEQLCST